MNPSDLSAILDSVLKQHGRNFIRLTDLVKEINSYDLSRLGLKKKSVKDNIKNELPKSYKIKQKGRTKIFFLMRDISIEDLITRDSIIETIKDDPGKTVDELGRYNFPGEKMSLRKHLIKHINDLIKEGLLLAQITATGLANLSYLERSKEIIKETRKMPETADEKTLIRQFKKAYEEVGHGESFTYIYQIRRYLGWSREVFDNLMEKMMVKGNIAAHPGNPGELTRDEALDCYQDRLGYLNITVTWRKDI